MINLNDLEGFDNLDDLNKELQLRANAYNQMALDDFEDLSPEQMRVLQYDFPKGESPLIMNRLSEKELRSCPLLMQVRFLINMMKGGKELKLTKTGALSTKVVREVYDLGFLENDHIETGISKLYEEEEDAEEISITKILLEISSLSMKRKNCT